MLIDINSEGMHLHTLHYPTAVTKQRIAEQRSSHASGPDTLAIHAHLYKLILDTYLEHAVCDRCVEHGYADGQAIQLALQLREDGGDCCCRSRRGGCEVQHARAAAPQVLHAREMQCGLRDEMGPRVVG